jgi:hypothetical protein
MPLVGFDPTIQAFERAKTVHAIDSAAILIGCHPSNIYKIKIFSVKHQRSTTTIRSCTAASKLNHFGPRLVGPLSLWNVACRGCGKDKKTLEKER